MHPSGSSSDCKLFLHMAAASRDCIYSHSTIRPHLQESSEPALCSNICGWYRSLTSRQSALQDCPVIALLDYSLFERRKCFFLSIFLSLIDSFFQYRRGMFRSFKSKVSSTLHARSITLQDLVTCRHPYSAPLVIGLLALTLPVYSCVKLLIGFPTHSRSRLRFIVPPRARTIASTLTYSYTASRCTCNGWFAHHLAKHPTGCRRLSTR